MSEHQNDRERRGKDASGRSKRNGSGGSRGQRSDFQKRGQRRGGRQGGPDARRSAEPSSRRDEPELPASVRVADLPFNMRVELKTLAKENAEVVARQLAVALAALEDDPAEASRYAQAAVKRAGRVGIVREIAGLSAYRNQDWALALRELRAHRRITGDQSNLAIIADTERGLGRPDDAIQLAEETDTAALPAVVRVELAIVVSGAWRDKEDLPRARAALEIDELNPDVAYSYSARLFEAYADVLDALGDTAAADWARRARLAEAAWEARNGSRSGENDDLVTDLGEIAE